MLKAIRTNTHVRIIQTLSRIIQKIHPKTNWIRLRHARSRAAPGSSDGPERQLSLALVLIVQLDLLVHETLVRLERLPHQVHLVAGEEVPDEQDCGRSQAPRAQAQDGSAYNTRSRTKALW